MDVISYQNVKAMRFHKLSWSLIALLIGGEINSLAEILLMLWTDCFHRIYNHQLMRLLKGALIVVVLIRWSYVCRFVTLHLLVCFSLIYGYLVRKNSIIQRAFVFSYYLTELIAPLDNSNLVYIACWDANLTLSIIRILWMS